MERIKGILINEMLAISANSDIAIKDGWLKITSAINTTIDILKEQNKAIMASNSIDSTIILDNEQAIKTLEDRLRESELAEVAKCKHEHAVKDNVKACLLAHKDYRCSNPDNPKECKMYKAVK